MSHPVAVAVVGSGNEIFKEWTSGPAIVVGRPAAAAVTAVSVQPLPVAAGPQSGLSIDWTGTEPPPVATPFVTVLGAMSVLNEPEKTSVLP